MIYDEINNVMRSFTLSFVTFIMIQI